MSRAFVILFSEKLVVHINVLFVTRYLHKQTNCSSLFLYLFSIFAAVIASAFPSSHITAMALPTTTDEWVLESPSGLTFALQLKKSVPIPALGDEDVLLEIKAVSLNYRDLAIAKVRETVPAFNRCVVSSVSFVTSFVASVDICYIVSHTHTPHNRAIILYPPSFLLFRPTMRLPLSWPRARRSRRFPSAMLLLSCPRPCLYPAI